MKRSLNFIIMLLLLVGFSFSTYAKSTDAELIQAKELILAGSFQPADQIISSYIQGHPQDPYGYLMRGIMNDWRQMLSGQYGALDNKVFNDFDEARILAQVAFDEDSHDLEKRIALGHALMYVSKKMIDQGHTFRAGSYLKRARDIMVYVQMQDPQNKDADLALGVFNYYSANVPKNLKWAASLLGFSGSAQKGLEYMKRATGYNNFSQADAQYLYIYTLYKHEKSFAQAQSMIDELLQKYSQNVEFRFLSAEIAYRKKDYSDSLKRFKSFDEQCGTLKCAKRYQFLSHYFQADIYKNLNDDLQLSSEIQKALTYDIHQERSRQSNLHKMALEIDMKNNRQKEACDHAQEVERLRKYNESVWNQVRTDYPHCFSSPQS